MRLLYLVFVSGCLCGNAQAFDTLTAGSVASTFVTSQLTSAPFENKLILDSRDDAAGFVASQGDARGVRLEAALHQLREGHPELTASDLELAEAILVQ